MEAAAEQRRLKIDALRRLRRAEAMGDKEAAADEIGLAVKRSFRSYDPVTGQAKQLTSYDELPDTVEKDTVIAQDTAMQAEQLDLTNIAPRRANWDLRRDLDKRLKRTERRQKEAILQLIRRRLAESGVDADTATAAAIASTEADELDDDDDENENDNDNYNTNG
ncbi:hypothetical protein MCUN1_003016 [Malassezia cuniculi]|uniref:Coiled-coil domain-containing protein 12 n=1 Tax=Malassezia cuniculi TaxID=948313 RepID=A0AAF0ESS2_9BASI|nr:hypothetical protein MCUN1_003016 [Malassezia cuniculi]